MSRVAGGDRIFIVGKPGAVGGAYLAQDRAGLREDLGDAEASADLDQFSARNNHFAALRERVQGQERGGCAVVYDERGRRCPTRVVTRRAE